MCLSMVTMDIHVIYLMYVLVINLRVHLMNLCIGVGTHFRLDSPVETLGQSLKYFVLNLRLCDAYHIIIPADTCGDIGVSR